MRPWTLAINVLFAAVLIYCRQTDVTHPAEGPGTAYPCGRWGVECRGPGNRFTGCCPNPGDICGGPDPAGFTRCEPGYCCTGPDPHYGAAPDGGVSRVPMMTPPLTR